MAQAKKNAGLSQPVALSRWDEIREAERVHYGTAQPARMDWRASAPYTCPELQHRSTSVRHPSIIAGRRVGGTA